MTAPVDLAALEKLEALHAEARLARESADGAHSDQQVVAETLNAFPAMAKALREAWQERDEASAFLGVPSDELVLQARIMADVAKQWSEACEIGQKCLRDEVEVGRSVFSAIPKVVRQRDEARAERDEARAEAKAARAELAGEDTLRKAALDAQEAMAALRQALTEARDEVARLKLHAERLESVLSRRISVSRGVPVGVPVWVSSRTNAAGHTLLSIHASEAIGFDRLAGFIVSERKAGRVWVASHSDGPVSGCRMYCWRLNDSEMVNLAPILVSA